MFGGGDDHGSHVVYVARGLLQRIQLLVVAVGLHLKPESLMKVSTSCNFTLPQYESGSLVKSRLKCSTTKHLLTVLNETTRGVNVDLHCEFVPWRQRPAGPCSQRSHVNKR